MKLFYKPFACSLSPHIVLLEAGRDFTLEKVDLATKKTESGKDFYQINPKGQVPTLELNDGSILTEGVAIIQYIANLVPERKLMPEYNTPAWYHAVEWLSFISSELHKGFSPLFNPQTPADYVEKTKEKLIRQFGYVDKKLSEGEFLLDDEFSVADAYLFTISQWARVTKLDISQYANLARYLEKLAKRPTIAQALQFEKVNNK